MAKKRIQPEVKPMPAVVEETGLKLVRLEMPPEVHRQFRVESAKEGLSMAAMARKLIEQWTAARKVGGN
jgi:hypothetical protein